MTLMKKSRFSTAVFCLLASSALMGTARADLILGINCSPSPKYPEGPNGTVGCTIFNPFHDEQTVTIAAVISQPVGEMDDFAGRPTLDHKTVVCPGKAKGKDGECGVTVTFITDEPADPKNGEPKPEPPGTKEDVDETKWTLTVAVHGEQLNKPGHEVSDNAYQGTFFVSDVGKIPEPSTLGQISLGCLLICGSRIVASRRTAKGIGAR